MGKINVNSRNNYLSTTGILDLIDFWTDQSVTTLAGPTFDSLNITNSVDIGEDLTVVGNLTIGGSTTIISTEIVEITDNIVELNAEETGTGVTLGSAGIEINRGTLTPYRIIFEESSFDTKIGQVGSLYSVATREDSPLNKGIAVYNDTDKRFYSTQTIELPTTFSSTEISSSSINGAVRIAGGMGIIGDIFTDGKISFKGSGGYTDNIQVTSLDTMKLTSSNDIDLICSSSKKINIPQDVSLTFDSGTSDKRIYNNGTQLVIENTADSITLGTTINGDINIPVGTFLRWTPTDDLRYDNTDITVNSSGTFKVNPVLKSTNVTVSTSSSVGAALFSGGISISNSTDSVNSSNGGTISSAGGAAFKKAVRFGDLVDIADTNVVKNQISGEGLNFRSRNRAVTSSSSVNTTFNSIEGGSLITSNVIPIGSSFFISGPPIVTGGGSFTNSYSLLVNSGNSLFNGNLIISDTTASSSPISGALLLSGGISINNSTNSSSYNSGGSFTTTGGISGEKDMYLGGKIDIANLGVSGTQIDTQGINFRSRNRTFSTNSTINTTFNSFEGATIDTSGIIPIASTVYISSAPSVTGGGSITNSYSMIIGSGGVKLDDFLFSTLNISSTSSTTGSVRLSGGIGISNTSDATSSTSGGTFSSAGGGSFAKKLFVGSGINSTIGTASGNVNHVNMKVGTLDRFSIGLRNVESGSNIGSDFFISRSNDAGTLIDNILSIDRSTGVTSLPISTSSSSSTTGSLLLQGSIAISNSTDATSFTNGGTITSAGGAAFAKKVYIGTDLSVGNDIYIEGVSYLGQVNIDTNDGIFSVSGSSAATINTGSASSFKTSSGSLTLDSEAGTLILDGNNGVTIDSISGISIDAGAASNFSTTDVLTLEGNGIIMNGGTGSSTISGDTGVNLTTSSLVNGIKVGTTVSGIPVTIGHSSSETTIGDNLVVNGDLTILGTTTSIESTLITINDNAIVVNNMPSGTSDGGFIVRRYQTPNDLGTGEVVTDTIKETSTFGGNSSGVDTIILNGSASAVNNFYKGWWIRVISGTGSGQVRRISSYTGSTKTAILYSTANSNPNGDGLDLTTAVSTGDNYNLYDSPYVGMFFDESNNEVAIAGVAFDPSLGEFPATTSYYPIHADSIVIETSFTTSGEAVFDGNILVDSDHLEAILVRKDGDTGDVFAVDSINGKVTIGNPVSTIGSKVTTLFNQTNSISGIETYSKLESEIVNNVSGNLVGKMILSVQNDTEGLIPFLTLTGGVSGNTFIDTSPSVDSFRINNTTASTSSSSGSFLLSGGIGISNTTDAISSVNGGTFSSAGGAAIAKKLFVGGNSTFESSSKISGTINALTSSSAGVNINGDIGLYNSSDSKIIFNNVSQSSPSFTSRSNGTKIVLRGEISGSSSDYAIGNEVNAQWYSVPTSSDSHIFYQGIIQQAKISSSGISILQANSGIRFDNGVNYSGFRESSDETRFKPHTSDINKGILFSDTTDTLDRVRINSDGKVSLGLSGYSGTPSVSGKWLDTEAQTFTDNDTVSTGTASINSFHRFSQNTLSASNLSVTTTDSISFLLGGAPIRGTNQTITNAYNVYIDTGADLTTVGTINNASSLYIKGSPSASGTGTITNSYSLFIDDGISRFDGKIISPNTFHVPVTENTFSTDQGSINISGDLVLKNGTKQGIFFNDSGSGAPSLTNRSVGSKLVLKPAVSGSTVDNAIGINGDNTWYSTNILSGSHEFYLGNSRRTTIDQNGLILGSSGTGVSCLLRSDTTDGSDDRGIIIAGGGDSGISRGAQIEIYGNENNSGNIVLSSGSAGQISMNTNGTQKFSILNNGEIVITNTTDTTGTGTGSIRTPGGLNVDKSLFVGTNFSLNFNQLYSYTGDVSGRLNTQSKTSSIGSVIRNFTNDGDNTDNNVYEIFGKGTPFSLVNTESLQIGYNSVITGYNIKTAASGTGTVRSIVIQTGVNTDQVKLLDTGDVTMSSVTVSNSSSTGALVMSGGISINNTTNAVSVSNGGTFTTGGGGSVAKDFYIGGNLYVTSGITGGITSPSVIISNELNVSGSVLQSNNRNDSNGVYRSFSIVFRATPISIGLPTSFEFDVPEVTTNFTTSYDITATINGNFGASPESVENCILFSVSGGTTCRVQFTSSSTGTHILHCNLRYNI